MQWDKGGPRRTPKKVSGAWGTPQNYYSTDSFYYSFFLKPLTLISELSFFFLLSCHTLFISSSTVYCSLPCHLLIIPFPSDLYLPFPLFLPSLETSLACSLQVIYENKVYLSKKWNYLRDLGNIYLFIPS